MEETRPEFTTLVIEFADADVANQAILRGLAAYGWGHDCQFFYGSHRLQQTSIAKATDILPASASAGLGTLTAPSKEGNQSVAIPLN
ncbi:hypothetical protein N7476_004972 [Penicillium atrosanguineum]|uniref:Uncharacterized protein n=1 Tax=Penicillium atrosanguineum TaxID=1132637 RepID=A0A9W9U771_9EURO|nr:hypothetical protein N7476_004972 [Penicillium atrosanguineum]